jgi:hypothetical protein
MKNHRRMVLILLLLGLFLLLAFLYRAFLLENFVKPVALVFWLVWRVLLSFDQRVIWSLLIILAIIYVVLRMARQGMSETNSPLVPDSPLTLINIEYWRSFIMFNANNKFHDNILRQNLVQMLVTMYTSRQPDTPLWEIAEAFRLRQIPLPDNIYSFLFPPVPLTGRPPFRQMLQNLRHLPARAGYLWSGRTEAGYYRSLDEVLNFMESSLEINHADK